MCGDQITQVGGAVVGSSSCEGRKGANRLLLIPVSRDYPAAG
jgi:hypothetical protein